MPDMPRNNSAIVELVLQHPTWGPEYIEQLAAASRGMGGAGLSPQRSQEIAAKVALDHPDELLGLVDMQRGIKVNTAGLDPAYVAKLAALGVTDDAAAQVAAFTNPGASRVDALRAWQDKARKMTAAQPEHYDPNVSVPTESDV